MVCNLILEELPLSDKTGATRPGEPEGPLVSVFTAACDAGEGIGVAYRSLLRQTYPRWEWVVVDDSRGPETGEYVARLADSADGRVRLYRQHPRPGSIGATKAAAGALCRGDFLVELDHDDELLPEALEIVAATFSAHPDIDFVYSDWIDRVDAEEEPEDVALYPAGWGFGYGAYAREVVGGRWVTTALAPPVTWETVRHIVGMPNHLRAWRADFYREVGGHDHRLPVADDYELLVRTFLRGTMARIPRPLYVQHHKPGGGSASRSLNGEIQEIVRQTAVRYEDELDRRCLALGLTPRESPAWPGPEPVLAGNATVDVLAEAAADLGAPLVSVVIPTYRRPELLERAVESVLEQTYPNFEVLVVGDCCPLAGEVVRGLADHRLRYWNLERHSGDSGATPRNYALKAMARGTLVAYLDDDNRWRSDHLESLVGPLVDDPAATFAFGSFELAGETIVCRRPRRFQIDTSALVHRRFLLERFGYWRPPSGTGWAHDWELVSRWEDEPWVATLEPTLHYSFDPERHGRAVLEAIKAAAEEERVAAGR
jgi:glycosyltransferase involved in cell wall biosynthesis